MDRARTADGFTLIELLVVIAILGALAAVLLPQVFSTGEAAKVATTEATMLQLETGIGAFVRKHGYHPPDDLKPVEPGAKAPWKLDNGRNTGIESLVCFLSQSRQDGMDLGGLADYLDNLDADDHGVELPLLRRRERLEVVDPWRTPLCYWSRTGIDRPQQVVVEPGGDPVAVQARRRADGTPYGAGKFQLLSAGPDRTFGTDDDIVWPTN